METSHPGTAGKFGVVTGSSVVQHIKFVGPGEAHKKPAHDEHLSMILHDGFAFNVHFLRSKR
jgi:hypothetical protein